MHSGSFVLLLRREDDNLGMKTEGKDREEIFGDQSHYNTK